jgi:hypothetical protein
MSDQTTAASTGAAGDPGTPGTPAGWYPDPQGAMRWWDGTAWTTHVAAGSGSSVTRTATILSTRAPELDASSSRLPRLPQLPRLGLPQLGRRTWVVIGAVVAVLALLAGYLLFGRGGGDTDAAASVPVVHALTPQQIVQRTVVTTADLKGGLVTSMIAGGDKVAGQVTLSGCGYRFTSEAHRVARRQVNVLSAQRQMTGLSNEVVAYDSAASAALAVKEFRSAVSHCPTSYVEMSVPGHPQVTVTGVRVTELPASSRQPGDTTDEGMAVTYSYSVKGVKGLTGTIHFMGIVERKGAVVDYFWLNVSQPLTADLARGAGAVADAGVAKLSATVTS